ncbi:MAG TPA: biotin transporter BioY [Actinomycetota bacterium]|nr:biotin transporter BioY [Actinomycetota bacterium]
MSTIAESLLQQRTRLRAVWGAVAVVAGSLLIAGLAQVSIRLPFTPVPITGQTLGVLLVGASLGPVLGTASVALYLLEGAIGLPFFAEGESGLSVLGAASATGGYLWGFVLAATLVGWLSRQGWDRSIRSSIGAMFIGEVVIYLVGVPWLIGALDVPLAKGLELGLYPFVIGDTIKLLIVAGVLPAVWKLIRRYLRSD